MQYALAGDKIKTHRNGSIENRLFRVRCKNNGGDDKTD
jgi:hypothetical protein